jgi:hypothetical protein
MDASAVTCCIGQTGSPELPISGVSELPIQKAKIVRRYIGLGRVLDRFAAAGFKNENIFVAGHSAGGFVALSWSKLGAAFCLAQTGRAYCLGH